MEEEVRFFSIQLSCSNGMKEQGGIRKYEDGGCKGLRRPPGLVINLRLVESGFHRSLCKGSVIKPRQEPLQS